MQHLSELLFAKDEVAGLVIYLVRAVEKTIKQTKKQ